MRVGVTYLGDHRCEFTLWAPQCSTVAVKLMVEPQPFLVSLRKDEQGYWHGLANEVPPGTRYGYFLNDDKTYPDPTSHWQPDGVHELSAIVNHQGFAWTDQHWENPPLRHYLIYELHVGTFTPQGTFDAIIPRLPRLVELGVKAVELMPVAQCPGQRNWGYDGVYPYAVQQSYGGPEGLKRLVNACHDHGLAVILDVVYNHLGPEGNYTTHFAPYFTDKYQTPWGKAMNYDDRFSAGVRNFVIQNALYWLRDYHIDALRLDAIQTIYDFSARSILEELAEAVDRWAQHQGKSVYLIAETDNNDVRVLRSRSEGGYGIHAQWSDDFHHALHSLLTGERQGYYQDFGEMQHLARVMDEGFAYSGQFSKFRQCHRGSSARDRLLSQFVVYSQNHDQVGNRIQGERLNQLVGFDAQKLGAAMTILSPYIPLLFMGEEYGETNPFLYFVNHSQEALNREVHEGRKREFAALNLRGEPPFVADVETYLSSQLQWHLQYGSQVNSGNQDGESAPTSGNDRHYYLWQFYQHLIKVRNRYPSLTCQRREHIHVDFQEAEKLLLIHRHKGQCETLLFCNFHPYPEVWSNPHPGRLWTKVFDSADAGWGSAVEAIPSQGRSTIAPDQIHGGMGEIPLQAHNVVLYHLAPPA